MVLWTERLDTVAKIVFRSGNVTNIVDIVVVGSVKWGTMRLKRLNNY